MITTLLFDLDGVLLDNDPDAFLPAYLDLLARHFDGGVGVERIRLELVNAYRTVMSNTDPTRNLWAIFQECFSLGTRWTPVTVSSIFDDFHRQSYPRLRALTRVLPAARAVIEWAFTTGYEVAIAASPIFRRVEMVDRLRWAGIDNFPYALIPSIEDSHFAKPHPEYFGEVLARLGRRPDEALVIGSDWAGDMLPAAALGMPHYWIKSNGTPPPPGGDGAQPLGAGTLEDFPTWALNTLPRLSAPSQPSGHALPYLLSANLAAVAGMLAEAGLTDQVWAERPAASEWSLTEIVCHLRDVERDVHLPRLLRVINTDNPFISGADTDPWAAERDYQAQSGPQALQDFIAARKETYGFLRTQPESAWSRPARHAIFGPTQLAEIAGWILDHDRLHLAQLRKTKASVGVRP